MPTDEKKGITVKIDAGLHAEVRQFLESHEMTGIFLQAKSYLGRVRHAGASRRASSENKRKGG